MFSIGTGLYYGVKHSKPASFQTEKTELLAVGAKAKQADNAATEVHTGKAIIFVVSDCAWEGAVAAIVILASSNLLITVILALIALIALIVFLGTAFSKNGGVWSSSGVDVHEVRDVDNLLRVEGVQESIDRTLETIFGNAKKGIYSFNSLYQPTKVPFSSFLNELSDDYDSSLLDAIKNHCLDLEDDSMGLPPQFTQKTFKEERYLGDIRKGTSSPPKISKTTYKVYQLCKDLSKENYDKLCEALNSLKAKEEGLEPFQRWQYFVSESVKHPLVQSLYNINNKNKVD